MDVSPLTIGHGSGSKWPWKRRINGGDPNHSLINWEPILDISNLFDFEFFTCKSFTSIYTCLESQWSIAKMGTLIFSHGDKPELTTSYSSSLAPKSFQQIATRLGRTASQPGPSPTKNTDETQGRPKAESNPTEFLAKQGTWKFYSECLSPNLWICNTLKDHIASVAKESRTPIFETIETYVFFPTHFFQ